MSKQTMTNTKAIKTFFEKDGGRSVSLSEMKDLTMEERAELGALAAEALGVEIDAESKVRSAKAVAA